MTTTTTNLLQGPADLWVAAFGATEPANAATAPAVAWVDAGSTDGGTTLTLGQTYSNMSVDQVAMPVGSRLTEQSAQVATTLAEATLANFRRALNQAVSAATTVEFGGEDIVNTDPAYQAVLLKGRAPGGTPRIVILRRTLSTESIGVPFQKDGKTVIPVTWTAYYVSPSIKAVKIDDTPGP
ncbi:MAG: hypothetical protein HOV83_03945 [Catenulispora sp.]|nr:hypothetical protein [Catenulispora sp.]